MDLTMSKLKRLVRSYEVWVAANPETVSDLETTTKWVSYFIAGRISDSTVVSELIYSLSNLLSFYNDRIIDKSRQDNTCANTIAGTSKNQHAAQLCYRLKVILTSLEYCEVFIEISARRVFGNKGKWLLITLLQVAKAAGRFFILKYSTEHIIRSPAMPSLNRRALIKQEKAGIVVGTTSTAANNHSFEEHDSTFHLKRSGRVMRKVEGAPPLQYRDFKMRGGGTGGTTAIPSMPMGLLQAEYLYVAKPLIHLAAMGIFGQKRWKQYVIALAMDLISIRLYHKNRHLMSKEQRLEMSRRCVNLLLYLMRSPFYERYTQSRLERALSFVAQNIPIVRMVAGPIKEYIPHWQNTYFYMWST